METKEVEFYGDKLSAVQGSDGKVYIALPQLVENLGLSWNSQHTKVMANPILNSTISIIGMVAADGRTRDMVALPAEMIPGYILTLNINKLREELRPKVYRYAKEAYKVLADVFMGQGFATHPNPERVDTHAMGVRAQELAIQKHNLALETTRYLLELDPNYSRASLSRMVELSMRANLQGELVQSRVVLDVGAFLVEMGLKSSEARKVAPAFGKAVKAAFTREYGTEPPTHFRFVEGAERKVCAYTEEHRPLMEKVYKQKFLQ